MLLSVHVAMFSHLLYIFTVTRTVGLGGATARARYTADTAHARLP